MEARPSSTSVLRRAIFLDRDGVINRQLVGDYVVRWEQFAFLPGVLDALRELAAFGLPIFVITNQQCVGKGLLSETALSQLHERMTAAIRERDGEIHGIYVCPHLESDNCDCRKPKPGLLLRAAEEHDINLPGSWFIGDSGRDVVAGHRAGCQTLLLGEDWKEERTYLAFYETLPTLQADALSDAVDLLRPILSG